MEESQMTQAIADELKEMRKGKGIPGWSMKRNSIIVAAFEGHPSLIVSHLEDELAAMGEGTGAGALAAALAIGDVKRWPLLESRHAEELTLRRRSYAENTGVSERTLSRHEDDAIEVLSRRLASRFREPKYQARIAARYTYDPPSGPRRYPGAGKYQEPGSETGKATGDLPNDIPGLLKLQAQKAAELRDLTENVKRINERLAAVLGHRL